MKNITILIFLGIMSKTAFGENVEDILSKKIVLPEEKKEVINKFDIYQCGYYNNGVLNYKRWIQCLDSESSTTSRFDYPDKTNNLYSVLVTDYGLNTHVSCKLYSSSFGLSIQEKVRNLNSGKPITHTDISFTNFSIDRGYNAPNFFILGSPTANIKTLPFSLWEDLDNDIKDIALLTNPEITNNQKNEITLRFQNRHRFIEKSCGKDFTTAFNLYLNDYASFAKGLYEEEVQRKQKVQEAKDQKLQEKINAQKEEKDRHEREQVLQEKELKVKQEKFKQLEECKKTKYYQLYITSKKITELNRKISYANQTLMNDDERQRISGVSDLNLRYRAATVIQESKKDLQTNFIQYKNLGGKASSSSSVVLLTDSCNL